MSIKRLLPVIAVAIVLPGASFWAASAGSSPRDTLSADSDAGAARLEPVPGERVRKVVLSAPAADRLGIETAAVTTLDERRTVVPYSSVLYDVNGDTWVYTNPEPLSFLRHRVSIDRIDGDEAVLLDGPPTGTMTVTVGGAQLFGTELFGTEFEVGQ